MGKRKSKVCEVDGCSKPAVKSRGICVFHEDTHEAMCVAPGCTRPRWANGFCMKCNRQTDRTGSPSPKKRYTSGDAKGVYLRLSAHCREVLESLGNGSVPRKGVEILEDYARRHSKSAA